jgi:tRNA(adenine34) deaminase
VIGADEAFMRRCLALAAAAKDQGETAVGAIVVRDGEILAEGLEATRATGDPTAHAEVEAIRAALHGKRSTSLAGCTLYTTVEPCLLCSYVIRQSGLSRVVYGVPAGHLGGATSPYALLTDAKLENWPPPPEVVASVLAAECGALLRKLAS